MKKILVIYPYRKEILKAIINAVSIGLASIIVLGSRNKIIELCYLYRISHTGLDIINVDNEIDVCLMANELMQKENIKGIIFGNLKKKYQNSIMNLEYDISVIDIPSIDRLLFIASSIKNDIINYENKKEAILETIEFMNRLNIIDYKVGLIIEEESNLLNLEKDVIKSVLDIEVNIMNVKRIFFNEANLLIFKDFDTSRVFIETLTCDNNIKYANLKKASDFYIIDALKMNFKSIFFSIFLFNKMTFNS